MQNPVEFFDKVHEQMNVICEASTEILAILGRTISLHKDDPLLSQIFITCSNEGLIELIKWSKTAKMSLDFYKEHFFSATPKPVSTKKEKDIQIHIVNDLLFEVTAIHEAIGVIAKLPKENFSMINKDPVLVQVFCIYSNLGLVKSTRWVADTKTMLHYYSDIHKIATNPPVNRISRLVMNPPINNADFDGDEPSFIVPVSFSIPLNTDFNGDELYDDCTNRKR